MPLFIVRERLDEVECDAVVRLVDDSAVNDGLVRVSDMPHAFEILIAKRSDTCADVYPRVAKIARENSLFTVALPLFDSLDALTLALDGADDLTLIIASPSRREVCPSRARYLEVDGYLEKNLIGSGMTLKRRIVRKKRTSPGGTPVLGASGKPILDRRISNDIRKKITDTSSPDFLTEIELLLMSMDDSFALTLMKLIDLKGMSEVECYKRANVSRQTWYKILNDGTYRPSKNTVLAFAISLRLTLPETERLLATAGFAISHSSRFDVIIEYFIIKGIYDINEINQTLYSFDEPCLGA
ncbi:MAG: helix-turn-helix transcriptional regulator [Clostridia bacterium]|nr:helix-turn-helix transcriptional regulator [Clostridia bacterium]